MKGSHLLSGLDRARKSGGRGALPSELLNLLTADERTDSLSDEPAKPAVIDPQVKRRAIEWLIALDSPERVYEQWSQFQTWLNERPEHREMYLWVERTWHEAGVLVVQQSRINSKGLLGVRDRWPRTRWRVRRRRLIFRGAQVVIFCLLFGTAYWLFAPTIRPWKEYASEELKPIVLADDSIVNLNLGSRLRVKLGWRARELVLEQGDALFQVKKEHPSREFLVHAHGTTIRATGTEFIVNVHHDGKVVAAVSEGKVEVRPSSPRGGESPHPSQTRAIDLSEGDQITVDNLGGVQREHPGVLAIQRQALWKDGLLSLDQRPLSEWVAAFNEYQEHTRQKLSIVDPSIAGILITGVFRTTEPKNFVQAIQSVHRIRASVKASESEPGITVIELRAADRASARK